MNDTRTNITRQRRGPNGRLLPSVKDTPIKPILDSLNAALRTIRENHPEVPNVVLVVGQSSKKALGHFAAGSWEAKDAQHEIMVSGESLAKGAEDVLDTLLHECAHALAHAREIKDTSRQGRFHNTRFKDVAEEMGLHCEKDSSIGWSLTTLTDASRVRYAEELKALKRVLKAYRKPPVEKAPAAKTTIKIECGCRSVTVPISFVDKGDLTCNECSEPFLPVVRDLRENRMPRPGLAEVFVVGGAA